MKDIEKTLMPDGAQNHDACVIGKGTGKRGQNLSSPGVNAA